MFFCMLNFTPVIRQYAEIFTDMDVADHAGMKSPGKEIRDMTSALLSSVAPFLPAEDVDDGKRLGFFIFTALSSTFLTFLQRYNAVSSREDQKSIMDALVKELAAMLTDKDDDIPPLVREYVKTLFVSNLEFVSSELSGDKDSEPASLKGLCEYICDYVENTCGVASDTHLRRRVESIIQARN